MGEHRSDEQSKGGNTGKHQKAAGKGKHAAPKIVISKKDKNAKSKLGRWNIE